jgi:hypothetical protein
MLGRLAVRVLRAVLGSMLCAGGQGNNSDYFAPKDAHSDLADHPGSVARGGIVFDRRQ